MIDVMSIDKACLDKAVACIEQTYRDGDEFVFTSDEYIEWLLPFLAVDINGFQTITLNLAYQPNASYLVLQVKPREFY